MLNRIIAFSVNNKLIVGLFVIALILYGSYQVTKLPIDAVPDITDNQVQVITVASALGAPDVERLITFPIELANNNIPGLKQIRSFSRFGLSVVTIVFDDKVDIYWARQQVSERLKLAEEQIPKGFGTPALAPVTTGLGEIYQYSLRPEKGYEGKYTAMDLRTIQDWIVRRQLLGVKGVADVASFGGLLKQYEIAIDPAKLKAYNITLHDVFVALENNNQNTGGAYIEKGPTVLFIRSEGLVGSFEDIKNIVVKNTGNGTPLLIGNVADVRLGNATRYGAMTYNGEGEVAGAVVMMLKGANSNAVIKDIKQRITEIQKTLPEGIMIDPFLDRTKMVNNSISTVSRNLLEGALIVVFVLVLFLGNFRAGFLVASVIPLAMLFAIIMMNLFGVSGNLMSLGALDFGLIVDGAVIIVEAVMHRLAHHRQTATATTLSQNQMNGEVSQSAGRMMNSAVFGQVIILIVYLPIFTLEGIEGKMFMPMAQTVAFALLGAFILSLTYIPMMSALVLSKNLKHSENFSDRIMARLSAGYGRAFERVAAFPKTIIGIVVAMFFLSVFILTRLGGEFIPVLPEGDFAVETRVLPGSNLSTSTGAVSAAAKILLAKFPEVVKVVGKTGSSEIPTDPMPIDASDMMVILKDKNEWTSATTYNGLMTKMAKELEAVPGVSFGFQYPVAMRFNELMTGARQDIVCKIFGENLDTLALYAQKLGQVSNTVEGASDLYIESVTGLPQIVIEYKRGVIAQYGLNISAVNEVINAAFAGKTAGLVFEGEKRFDLVVRLSEVKRKDLSDVQNLLIPLPGGNQIPLSTVADVSVIDGPNQIQRENSFRRIVVGFNARGRDVQSMVKELQQKVAKQIKLPPGYYITYGGAFENLEVAKKRLAIAVPVSLVLIFLMLYFAFNSVKHSLLIYTAIPLSAMGGILALLLRGMPFSISAGVGFIALFGVSVLNGIVLIAEFNRLKNEGWVDLKKMVIEGTKTRLRPVLMTATVASLGFLPMALSNGEGAEVQRPLATVVIGGLLLATFLTLFILPLLYLQFEKVKTMKSTLNANMVLVLLMLSLSVGAQQPVTLQAATDMAIKNNLHLRNERLQADYLKKIKGTAWDIPQTNVNAEYGQINSLYNDTKFGVSQSISFPLVYARQKAVYNEEWKNGLLNVALKENELKKAVAQVYYSLLHLKQKQKLLLQTDSMYARFQQNAGQKFAAGESNTLEKASADMQRFQITQQLSQLEQDYAITLLQFKILLNTDDDLMPDENEIRLPMPLLADSQQVSAHPYIKMQLQQQQISNAALKLNRAKLAPALFAGYSNQSIIGLQNIQGTERNFTGGHRFSAVQVGLGIPLFFGSQKAGINAAAINRTIASGKYEVAVKDYNNNYKQAWVAVVKYRQLVQQYENSGNKSAGEILNTAGLQLQSGNIDYLQWVMLVNQAIVIQSAYADAVNSLNQSIIEINSLTNK